MKLLGILLLVCACASAGVMTAMTLQQSKRRAQAWIRLLGQLRTELRYTARPVQNLLADAADMYGDTLPWLKAFRHTDTPLTCPSSLCAEDKAFATMFFEPLGTTDLEGQLEHIERCLIQADERYQTASEKASRCSKAYVATGLCAGLCIGLLLI